MQFCLQAATVQLYLSEGGRNKKMPANRESNSHFDEKAGVAECKTPWGRWYQVSYCHLLLAASKFCFPNRIHHCKIDGEFESSSVLNSRRLAKLWLRWTLRRGPGPKSAESTSCPTSSPASSGTRHSSM